MYSRLCVFTLVLKLEQKRKIRRKTECCVNQHKQSPAVCDELAPTRSAPEGNRR